MITQNSKVLITGVSGQDGQILLKKLINTRNYGVSRSLDSHENCKVLKIDLTQIDEVFGLIENINPDFIFHFSSQSSVGKSIQKPIETINSNVISTLNILEAIRLKSPKTKLLNASSGEIFGNYCENKNSLANELTPISPINPYAASKASAHHLVNSYKTTYGLKVFNAILFNHESKYRSNQFVTKKIVNTALKINSGEDIELTLGNLDIYRDWSHAEDYIESMLEIMSSDLCEDFIISSGKQHSLRELASEVFNQLGINIEKYVKEDERFKRPNDIHYMGGDNTKLLNYFPNLKFLNFKEFVKKLLTEITNE